MSAVWQECDEVVTSVFPFNLLCSVWSPGQAQLQAAWVPVLPPPLYNFSLEKVTTLSFNKDNNKEIIK